MSMMSGGGGRDEDPVPLIDPERPGSSGPRSVDPMGEPLPDPDPPNYKVGYPSKPVQDHIEFRAGGGKDEPANLDTKTYEANARKGGFEGNLSRNAFGVSSSGAPKRWPGVTRLGLSGLSHLEAVIKEFLVHHHQARPHPGLEQRCPAPVMPAPIPLPV